MQTVLIADDHEIVRLGIRIIIDKLKPGCQFLEVSNCTEVIHHFSTEPIQFATLDLFLADGNLFSAIEQIRAYSPDTALLIYSMNAEHIYAQRLMQKGVRGFVSKGASITELEKAIACLLRGEIYLSPEMKNELFRTVKPNANPIDSLSDRELEVVEYVATGLGSKEIAKCMSLDITTVSTYRRRAFEKLNVQNNIELKEKFLLYKMKE